MSGQQQTFQFDFGDEELNNPNYEQEVEKVLNPDTSNDNVTPDATAQEQQKEGAQDANQAASIDGQRQSDQQDAQQDAQQDGQQPESANSGSSADQQATAQQEQERRPIGATQSDDKGNIVDSAGNIIARAGGERRLYERSMKQQRYIDTLEQDNRRLKEESQKVAALGDMPQKLGLNNEDVQLGMQTVSAFKKDPAATARWMLQETLRLGYNLGDVIGKDAQGQVNGGSLDLQAVKSMISEAVGPLTQDRQAQLQNQEQQQKAQREYERFMAKHENAEHHEDLIAAIVQRDDVDPEVAYWQLREYAARNGLDFAKPLRAQVEARKSVQTSHGNATPQAQPSQPNVAPMPQGAAPTQPMQSGPTMFEPNESWDRVIQQSLREAGFN